MTLVNERELHRAIETGVPPGAWAVGVSGGADSVGLLSLLLRERADLSIHVVHLNHETRGQASEEDARFVEELAGKGGLPCTIARRSGIEADVNNLPANPSARYRALRLALFKHVIDRCKLDGVILAHHADDQAETVLQRLLRGSGAPGLTGMRADASIDGVRVLRPLLGIGRAEIRSYLKSRGVAWREDASNASDQYERNRVRLALAGNQRLVRSLLEVAHEFSILREWVGNAAPDLAERFDVAELQGLPGIVARESARRWLAERGSPMDDLTPAVLDRLIEMAADAATPARQEFPGRTMVARKGGLIGVRR